MFRGNSGMCGMYRCFGVYLNVCVGVLYVSSRVSVPPGTSLSFSSSDPAEPESLRRRAHQAM